MFNDRSTHSTLALLVAMLGMGCSVASVEDDVSGGRTQVAEKPRPRCITPSEGRRAISKNPKECPHIFFVCAPGETPFLDACGCGCERR
ncbi:hypothetical protein [Myxococcus landrumensis]|uniref:Lipoprotein n=1 Tax=Myxococcus landrumensis TaxID=2813577 RepID=A0ABX7NEY8_9BACT|nr:hypothetical protein [Myxococcus landrumus]QSQ17367.1 hypothetical protein JY572_15465 [Myxococcus landrumus]